MNRLALLWLMSFAILLVGMVSRSGFAATTRPESSWHEDAVSGLRFRIPFQTFAEKSQGQVEALILEDPAVSLPEGIRYTSGVYAGTDAPYLPYVLVWTRADERAPTRADLDDLGGLDASEAKTRFGLDEFSFDARMLRGEGSRVEAGGLRSRILFQVARGETVFVGLFYDEKAAADKALFSQISGSLALKPERLWRYEDLPRGWPRWGTPVAIALGAAVLGLIGAIASRRRNLRLGVQPKADAKTATSSEREPATTSPF